MERKNDSSILLLVAAGLGIYWLLKKQSVPPATTIPAMPVLDQPITAQPVIEQPINVAPTPEIISQPQEIEYTPVSDMISTMNISNAGKLHEL